MIPQDVYAEISELFGIPHEVSNYVYKHINAELHDIRRLPKKKVYVSPGKRKSYIEKITRIESSLLKVMSTPESEKAFWVYCLLSLLTERIASAIILDLDPLEYKDNILKGIECDLNPLIKKVLNYVHVLKFSIDDLKNSFYDKLLVILRNAKLIKWVRENLIEPRILDESKPLEVILREAYSKILGKKKRYQRGIHLLAGVPIELAEKFSRAVADSYEYSTFYYRAFIIISQRSRIYDYMIVAGYPIDIISETLYRVSKRRAAGLGRDVLRCLEELEDEDKIKECISKHLDTLNNIYIKKHGLNLDSNTKKKYVEMVIEADRIIDMLLGKYPYTLHRD